jgi:NAD(P)-dependent dehydrogenase (short-subunit alcohol dehydrogenase family)
MVTGGSSGIGRAFVRQVVARGAKVSVLALADEDLDATATELGATGTSPTVTLSRPRWPGPPARWGRVMSC